MCVFFPPILIYRLSISSRNSNISCVRSSTARRPSNAHSFTLNFRQSSFFVNVLQLRSRKLSKTKHEKIETYNFRRLCSGSVLRDRLLFLCNTDMNGSESMNQQFSYRISPSHHMQKRTELRTGAANAPTVNRTMRCGCRPQQLRSDDDSTVVPPHRVPPFYFVFRFLSSREQSQEALGTLGQARVRPLLRKPHFP